MFWKPTLAIRADAASFLVRLQKKIGKLHVDEGWLSKLKQRDSDKEEANKYIKRHSISNLVLSVEYVASY